MRRTSRARRAFNLIDSLEGRRLFAAPWGATAELIRQDDLANSLSGINGAGQTIAVLDTGVDYNHVALGGGFGAGKKVIAGYDFVDNDTDPMDTNGHGTAVAGVIAASSFESGGYTYQGIAPQAKLVAVRIAPDTTTSTPFSRIESGLQWVLANRTTYGITAVNLSFGSGNYTEDHTNATLSDELQQLADLNIPFVSSSGNGGLDDGQGISYPAADPNAFSVGAVNAQDVVSEFTQRSANLDLLAPGEGVVSVQRGGGYIGGLAGTSFAAPALTGTLALMRQVDSSFGLADLKSMIRASSPTTKDGDNEVGQTTGLTFQRLDVFSSVKLALQRKSAPAQASSIGVDGNENDLVFDDQGVLHFLWYDDTAKTMKYASRSVEGAWSAPSTIDSGTPNVGTEFSMKLDSYGKPVVAYLDGPNGDLKVARLNGESWALKTVDSTGVTGLYPSLVVDDSDNLYISYFRKTNRDLKVASYKNGVWNRETVDNDGDVGWSTTITLDNLGRPAIAYGDAGRNALKVARSNGSTWTLEVADPNTHGAAYNSIAFTASGNPVISYYEVNSSDLKFASKSNGVWTNRYVATRGATGLYTNLQLDGSGVASILYWDKRTNSLNKATQNGSGFSVSKVSSGAGKYTMAVHSPLDDKWLYATNTGSKLVLGEI